MAECLPNEIKNKNKKKMPNTTSFSTVHKLNESNKNEIYSAIKPNIKRSKSINTFKSSKEAADKVKLKKLDRNSSMLNSIENVYDCPKRGDKLLGMLKLNQKTSRFVKTKKNSENSLHKSGFSNKSNGNFFFEEILD